MFTNEFNTSVAAATDDSIGPIRLRDSLMFVLDPFVLHPDTDRPPQVIDWDSTTPDLLATFLDELID